MFESSDGTPEIRLTDLTKHFRDVRAVDRVSLDIRSGEFFSLLGPSGCGKTTTLRMIGGFELPTAGRIELRGRDVTTDPPDKRPVNMVFQNYALFPHLDVAGNIAFGLHRRSVEKSEIKRRVAEALDLVHLAGYDKRKPNQLSGGQQQRVALARALVLTPRVLLLDEPLGALDARLRKDLQVELKAIQKDIGVTFVFVTHDQEEALTMSDRVAVMNNGQVEQAGAPREVYEEPKTTFVADFLGVSNLLDAEAEADGAGCTLRMGERPFKAEQGETSARGEVKAMIRPERIGLEPHGTVGDNRLPGLVERAVFLGSSHEVHVRVLGGELLKATISNDGSALSVSLDEGTPVTVHLPPQGLRVLRQSEPPRAADAADDPVATAPSK